MGKVQPSGKRFVVDEWRPWPLLSKRQIEESPSFRLGMSFKHEKKLREAACKVIGEAGKTLDQGIITIAIAQTYLQRFFAIKPYQRNESFVVAVAALFVASKTENKPRALADIAHACWRHWVDLWVREQKRRRKDAPASLWEQQGREEKELFRRPEFCRRLAAAATTAERVLLYTTGFQFNVHTGFYVLLGCKNILTRHPDAAVVAFFSELNLQIVWNFVVECYRSTRLCLQFDPRTIGIACYEMTCTHLKREIPLVDGDLWWRHVARKMDWDLAAVGSLADMRAIQDELWAIFKPSARGQANGGGGVAPADGGRSAPGTPGPLSQPELLAAAGLQSQGASPAQLPLPSPGQAQVAGPSGRSHLSNGQLLQPAGATAQLRPAQAPPAQAAAGPAEREEGEVRFSPSYEFTASPRGSAPDDSAQTSAPTLLAGLESGELALDAREAAPTPRPDAAAQQARLAKFRAHMEKRKADGAAPDRPPDAKRARSPGAARS